MPELSVLIPARNEMFLRRTVEDVLANSRSETEVIAVLDGYEHELPNDPRVKVLRTAAAVGQRAATNLAAHAASGRYVMKLDGHCAMAEGFDATLLEDFEALGDDVTLVPRMYNLHAFDWVCESCGLATYQGVQPERCVQCGSEPHRMAMIWRPRWNRLTESWRFDRQLQFQYWPAHAKTISGDYVETMSFIGACMAISRERFWRLGGMDENHGSWGQFGTEWACKSWLSGGRLVTTRRTWFGHLFRTGNFSRNGASPWPYPISQQQIDRAREYSRDLWLNDRWPLAVRPLSWLVERFQPVPGWVEAGG